MNFKSLLEKTRQFYNEVRVELKKISWPPRKETMASTSVVLIIVIIVSCI
ncbi:MAG: preprotein translocase subunit SecE [Proteobacteria bacterium]|nr:preprotein translocase subunit SecE [Pseudomonadota bacterium]